MKKNFLNWILQKQNLYKKSYLIGLCITQRSIINSTERKKIKIKTDNEIYETIFGLPGKFFFTNYNILLFIFFLFAFVYLIGDKYAP